jgi:hypothetical protein
VVGSLLVSPPKGGELKAALQALSEKTWTHPGTGQPVRFGYSTIEKWLYAAKRTDDPVRALRDRPRGTAGRTKVLLAGAIEALTTLYHSNTNWTAKPQLRSISLILCMLAIGFVGPDLSGNSISVDGVTLTA